MAQGQTAQRTQSHRASADEGTQRERPVGKVPSQNSDISVSLGALPGGKSGGQRIGLGP